MVFVLSFFLCQTACRTRSDQNAPTGSDLAKADSRLRSDSRNAETAVGTVAIDFDKFRKHMMRFEKLIGTDRFQQKSQADSMEVQVKVNGTIGKDVYCEESDYLDFGRAPQIQFIAKRGQSGQTKIEIKGNESSVLPLHPFSIDLKFCAEKGLLTRDECYRMTAKEGEKGDFYFEFTIVDSTDHFDNEFTYVLAIEPGGRSDWHALAWWNEEDGSNGCRASNNLDGLITTGLYDMINAAKIPAQAR